MWIDFDISRALITLTYLIKLPRLYYKLQQYNVTGLQYLFFQLSPKLPKGNVRPKKTGRKALSIYTHTHRPVADLGRIRFPYTKIRLV